MYSSLQIQSVIHLPLSSLLYYINEFKIITEHLKINNIYPSSHHPTWFQGNSCSASRASELPLLNWEREHKIHFEMFSLCSLGEHKNSQIFLLWLSTLNDHCATFGLGFSPSTKERLSLILWITGRCGLKSLVWWQHSQFYSWCIYSRSTIHSLAVAVAQAFLSRSRWEYLSRVIYL